MKQLLSKIEKLKTLKEYNEESKDELISLLNYFTHSDDILIETTNVRFLLISILIAQIVPCYYGHDHDINIIIEKLLNNLQSLNIILNNIQSEGNNVQGKEKYPGLALHMIFGHHNTNLLHEYLISNNALTRLFILKQNLKDIQNIFFNDKLLAAVYSSKGMIDDDSLFSMLFNESRYSSWLVQQYYNLIKEDNLDYSNLTLSLFRRNNIDPLIEILIKNNQQSLINFKDKVYSKFSKVHKIKFVSTFLIKFFVRNVLHNECLTSLEKISMINYCFNQLSIVKFSEELAYAIFQYPSLTLKDQNILIYTLVANLNYNLSPAEFADQFIKIIKNYWSNESLIKDSSIHFQHALTLYLMSSLKFSDSNFLKKLVVDQVVLKSTTLHMEHSNEEVRFMGILFMETLSSMTDTGLDFHMDPLHDFSKKLLLLDYKNIVIMRDVAKIQQKIELGLTRKDRSDKICANHNKPEILPLKEFQNLNVMSNDLNQISDSDDDDYEDPTMATHNNSLPNVPVYLKDLNDYLTASSKESPFHAQLKRQIGLKSFNKLVRYKSLHNSQELNFWGKKLCSVIVNIKVDSLVTKGEKSFIDSQGKMVRQEPDSGRENDEYYNHLKLLCLISLCVCLPLDIPQYLVEILLTSGDLSIFDRLMVINSIGLAARELKGFRDDMNFKNLTLNLENPNKLVTHEQFMELQESHLLDNISIDMESKIVDIANKSNSAEDKSIGTGEGKIVKISSKLLKQREESLKQGGNQISEKSNNKDKYTRISHECFIKPYLLIWYTLRGDMTTLGTYSSTFTVSYMKTLNILIYCCDFPSFDLIKELLLIFIQFKHAYINISESKMTKHEKMEFLKSGLYLLLILLNNKASLFNFMPEIVQIFEWLNYLFEESNDSDSDEAVIKSLAAHCLLLIREILENNF